MSYFITPHARDRFEERFGGNIQEAIGRAVPFGAQRGSSLYLFDPETKAVFAIKGNPLHGSAVVTTLTKEMATENIRRMAVGKDHVSSQTGRRYDKRGSRRVDYLDDDDDAGNGDSVPRRSRYARKRRERTGEFDER